MLLFGIAVIAAGVLALLFSALQLYGYYHILDADAEVFARLRQRMIVSFVVGIVLAAAGAVSIFIRTRL